MGWALEHLGDAACKEIAEDLFRVEKIYGTKLHGFCPIHGDVKSSSFFYNWERDSYGCQSCGEKGDLVKLWCHVHGLDGQDLGAFMKEFADDALSDRPRSTRKKPAGDKVDDSGWSQQRLPDVFVSEEVYEALPVIPEADLVEIMGRRKWSRDVLELHGVKRFTDIKGKHRFAIPIRDDQGRLCNIRLYLPGADQYKLISWFDQVCPHCGGKLATVAKKKQCKECSKAPNDYGRTRLFPAPCFWRPGVLWLCEGEPDTLCALSQGINAVTQTAGCGTWPDEFSQAMAGRDVVICYDADIAGHKGAMKAAASLIKHVKSVRVMIWPDSMGSAA
jgi:putative DNA primase/helicase